MGTYCRQLHIIVGNITDFKGDAIVNAANCSLLGGGGVDGAIHRAAGSGLLAECRTLGGCKTGESKMTNAYNLPCKKVIHTVGPVWHGGTHGEGKLLASCYDTALRIAKEHNIHSIAFPCISTGVYGYPKAEAARIALHTIFAHIRDGFNAEVTIVCFSKADEQYYRDCFWQESLTLLGKRDEVKAYKKSIDEWPEQYWYELFAYIPRLQGKTNPFQPVEPHFIKGDLLENFTFCPAAKKWAFHFNLHELSSLKLIDDFYCRCIMATAVNIFHMYNSQLVPQSIDKQTLLDILLSLQEVANPIVNVFRTVQCLHSMGYQRVRLCPGLSPSGLNWRGVITTKANTTRICGAFAAYKQADDGTLINGMGLQHRYGLLVPQQMAEKLLADYKILSIDGKGLDPEYVEWFNKAVELAIEGVYIAAYADGWDVMHDGKFRLPGNRTLPLPPPGESDDHPIY